MDVYYRAPGVLELLAHRVAEMARLYQEAGVEVTLQGGSGDRLSETAQTAPVSVMLGNVVRERLVKNTNWSVVCVNTQHPLFWLVAQPSVKRVADLKGARVAGLPLTTAPTIFLRILFRMHGLDLMNDCSYAPLADEERVEQLQSGEAAAVYIGIGSGASPFPLERSGFRVLAFIGAEIPATATGLAVNRDLCEPDNPELLKLVSATRSALARLHDDRDIAIRAIQDIETEMSRDDAGLLYDRYIRPYWTRDGRPDRRMAEDTLNAIAQELEVARVPAFSELYSIP